MQDKSFGDEHLADADGDVIMVENLDDVSFLQINRHHNMTASEAMLAILAVGVRDIFLIKESWFGPVLSN